MPRVQQQEPSIIYRMNIVSYFAKAQKWKTKDKIPATRKVKIETISKSTENKLERMKSKIKMVHWTMAEMQDQLKRLTNQRKDKLWEILFAISCVTIFTLPIILNVSLYKDDFNRAYGGTLQWDTDGRIIGYLLYRIAHLGSARAVFDHPLGAIVCIPIMLLGGIFAYLLFQRKSLIWIGILSILLFGQPYFLENLSFSFDSPLMVLSTSICIAAAWICVSGEKPYLQAVSGSLVTIALLIYQPANNAFWIPVCVIAINSWGQTIKTGENNNPLVFSTRKLLFRCGLIQASSLAIYKIILTPFFKLNEYSNSVLSTLEIKNLPSTIVRNINEFWDTLLRNGFDSNLGRFLAFYILISIILITSRHTIWRGCIKFIMLLSILALSQILMLILDCQGLPIRTYIGVDKFLVSIALIAWSTFEKMAQSAY